ncbi:hypothetical protein ACFPRA_14380 [Sporosarcina soli]|uniref:ABC transporter permease n=1 Tax=Sporosarcina soli TaxID=334736 RepID=A0ABW0TMQ6_9BACL
MKRWRGLVQKEWAHMKWRLVFFVFLNNLLLFWGVSHLFLGAPEGFLTSIQPMIGICFTLHMIMAITLLFDSLGKEIGKPDIWLHSPASIRQLVGAKFVLVTLTVVCSLVVYGIVAGIAYVFGGFVFLWADVDLLLTVGVVILLNAVYVMAIVFFFWSIYQVFRSRIGWFSILVMIVLVNVWLYGWALVWFTEVFQTVMDMGPMYGPIQTVDLLMFNNYIIPGGTILTVGSLVLYGLLTLFYFVMGSMLFEKKVRL